jgi:hypothetical protein
MNVTPGFMALSPDLEFSGSCPAPAVDMLLGNVLKYKTRLWFGSSWGRTHGQQEGDNQAKQ